MRPLLPLLLALAACSADPVLLPDASPADTGTNSQVCTPGAQVACACVGGTAGAQVCAGDGRSLGACACPDAGVDVPAGDGGVVDVPAPDISQDRPAAADGGADAGPIDSGPADASTFDASPLDAGGDAGSADAPADVGVDAPSDRPTDVSVPMDRGAPAMCPSSCTTHVDCDPCRTASDPDSLRHCCVSGLCVSSGSACAASADAGAADAGALDAGAIDAGTETGRTDVAVDGGPADVAADVRQCGDGGQTICPSATLLNCVDTRNDSDNCGGCGVRCLRSGSPYTGTTGITTGCENGTCVGVVCVAGRANCDGDGTNGCETHIRADRMNCGMCGRVCTACDFGTCINL